MRILFLGTSAGWPLARLGCKCAICTSSDSRDKRSRPSLLINDSILLDAPIDIYQSLVKYGVNPTSLTHLIITHPHDDHVFGLYDLSHIYNLPNKITLISSKGVLASIKRVAGTSLRSFILKEVRPFEKVPLGKDAYGWLIPVEHGNTEAYGIKIKAPKPVLYAPEFRRIRPSSKKEIGDIEIAIIDGSSKTSFGQAKGHQTMEEGIRLANDIHAKKIFFTNIGHKTDTFQNLFSFVTQKGGDKFKIAFDGLELKV